MKVTREQAIKILDKATDRGGYDDWWMDLMEDFNLYDESSDTAPTIRDVFIALGVTTEELESAGV